MINIFVAAFKVPANMSARWPVSRKYVSNPVFLYAVVHKNLDNSQMKDMW